MCVEPGREAELFARPWQRENRARDKAGISTACRLEENAGGAGEADSGGGRGACPPRHVGGVRKTWTSEIGRAGWKKMGRTAANNCPDSPRWQKNPHGRPWNRGRPGVKKPKKGRRGKGEKMRGTVKRTNFGGLERGTLRGSEAPTCGFRGQLPRVQETLPF